MERYTLLGLIRNNQLVNVTGSPGIGKSEILKNVCHFCYERDYFKDGVIYINLSKCFTLTDFNNLLEEAFNFNESNFESK